jgi:hypothetical protein
MKNGLAARSPSIDEGTSNANVGIAERRVALVVDTKPPHRAPIWEPFTVEAGPPTDNVLHARPKQQLDAATEMMIIATIIRPLDEGSTHQAGNDAREHELRLLLAKLSPIEALTIRRRLDCDRDDDRLVVAFRRLLMERRQRLRAFLADPRRGRMK